MTDAYTIPRAELVARLRDYEGEVWETTMCSNHLREAAARRIEELVARIDELEDDVEEWRYAYGRAAE